MAFRQTPWTRPQIAEPTHPCHTRDLFSYIGTEPVGSGEGRDVTRAGRDAVAAAVYAAQCLLLMLVSATLLTVARPGLANGQDSVSSELVEFDIPEQPLAAALERFMMLSNVTIVADGGVVGARKS